MDMQGEQRIPAPRETVWAALNDPEILRRSIPGCESVTLVGENELEATVMAAVGPVKARFKGKVQLVDLDPPNGYRLVGEGSGGAAGFAKGEARVDLEEIEGGTLLKYTVKATVGGKLAQIGARLIDGTAKKLSDQFFVRFSEIAAEAGATPAAAEAPATVAEAPAGDAAPAPLETTPAGDVEGPIVDGAHPVEPAPAPAAVTPSPAAEERRGLSPALWMVGIAVIVVAAIWLVTAID